MPYPAEDLYPAESLLLETAAVSAATRGVADDRLSMSITHADGRVTRWGPDEPDATNIPEGLEFGTAIPGGFTTCSWSLSRRIDRDYSDLNILDDVRVYGPGNRTIWEGRVAQLPRRHDERVSINPGAVGWSAHLRDDPSFREIYVDRDMSRWSESPLPRRLRLASLGTPQGKIPVTIAGGGISWQPPNESLPSAETTEVQYDAGVGMLIGRLEYKGKRDGAFTSFEAGTVFTATVENFSTASSEVITLDDAHRVATTFTDGRYVMLRCRTSALVTPTAGHMQSFDRLVLIGASGAVISSAGTSDVGVLASSVVADILQRAAPELNYTTGTDGSIETTTFAVPHLIFPEPVTAEDAITDVNKFHLYEWGVYDNRTFFYRAPNPDRLTWQARLSDGARLDLEGDTLEQVFNGVMVHYRTGDGLQKIVGPTGGSFDDTSASLMDTSDSNPVNAHGLGRKWAKLALDFPTTLGGATAIGAAYLQERSLPQRRGVLTLHGGCVEHPTEGCVPVWRVRAGDFVKIADHPANVPRRIIQTQYSHDTKTLSATLDNTAAKLEAILARVGVHLIGVY